MADLFVGVQQFGSRERGARGPGRFKGGSLWICGVWKC